MGRSGHSLHMSFINGSLLSCNLFITQIRYRDAWIVFSEKVCCPKFVKRKWKFKSNDKDKGQFQTLHRGRMNKERTFHEQSKKVFTWLQFDESKQTIISFRSPTVDWNRQMHIWNWNDRMWSASRLCTWTLVIFVIY